MAWWIACLVFVGFAPQRAAALSIDDAVELTLQRNMQVLAARLEVEAGQMAVWAALIWPNPELSGSTSNIVLGRGNDQERDLRPPPFSQLIHNITLEQSLDLVGRRRANSASARAMAEAVAQRAQTVVLEVVRAVRNAYVEVEQTAESLRLSEQEAALWERTTALMVRRLAVGEAARLEVDKMRLEGNNAQRRVVDGGLAHRAARLKLAELMADEPEHAPLLELAALPDPTSWVEGPVTQDHLVQQAFAQRPDWRAIKAQIAGEQQRTLAQRRAVWPELKVAVGYSRSHFQISGDNPHSLGVGLGVALPVFDRNQQGRAEAHLALRQARLAEATLRLEIEHAVAEALSAWQSAEQKMALLRTGEVLKRAAHTRDLAWRGFNHGAHSLLEVLEAERTWVATQHEALVLRRDLQIAGIDLAFETGQSMVARNR